MDIIEKINTIQSTRYQGSKRKMLPWLYDCIKDIEFDTVLDAFGGSAMVSCLFKHMGKKVTYNDIFRFNQLIGESIIENNDVFLTDDDVNYILQPRIVNNTFISDTFHDIYYLNAENQWLDMIIQGIESLSDLYASNKLRFKKAIAYNALFQSCMVKRPYNLFHRKNLNMRLRDVERHFGNKTTWEKSFPTHFFTFIHEINNSIFKSEQRCRATCCDVFSIKNIKYDAVYLDPPYIKSKGESNESSDYLKCYHFLEGIANYPVWSKIIDYNSLNKRIEKSYAPNYFTSEDALNTFNNLLEKFRNSIIILSYKYGGTPTIDELSEMILRYKSQLIIHDKHYNYALNKKNGNASLNREYLLIGY